MPTGNHKGLRRTMKGIKPCWSVVRERVNERTHAGVNGSWQEQAHPPRQILQSLLRENRPNKPIILAVEGYALAGGTEILQGTDLRVGAKDAVFGVTEVARGLYPWSILRTCSSSFLCHSCTFPSCRLATEVLVYYPGDEFFVQTIFWPGSA